MPVFHDRVGICGPVLQGECMNNIPPKKYFNKIKYLEEISGLHAVSDEARDAAIYVTHFKPRDAEPIMTRMTARRLTPAATAAAGTVR